MQEQKRKESKNAKKVNISSVGSHQAADRLIDLIARLIAKRHLQSPSTLDTDIRRRLEYLGSSSRG